MTDQILWKPINHKLLFKYHISTLGQVKDSKGRIVEYDPISNKEDSCLHKVTLANGNATGKRKVTAHCIHTLMILTFPEALELDNVDPNANGKNKEKYKDEQWQLIVRQHLRGKYEISDMGRIRIQQTGWFVTPHKISTHLDMTFYLNNKLIFVPVHELVAEYFVEKTDPKFTYVKHKDGNKLNNRATNLEYTTKPVKKKKVIDPNAPRYKRDKLVVRVDFKGNRTVYNSIVEAARLNNISSRPVKNCLRGLQKSHNGYKWIYEPMIANKNIQSISQSSSQA